MADVEIVVLGGSIAGCCAAAALAGPGRRVLVLERDALPDSPRPRRGVPQDRQPHVLLRRGLNEAEALLPGLTARLRARGAVPLDTGRLPWLTEWGWLWPGPSIEILSLSRPLLESQLRASALALPGVRLRDGAEATGMRREGDRWLVSLAGGDEVPADVVVDASGRSSRVPVWLERGGFPVPEVTVVDAKVGYAARLFSGARPGFPGLAIPLNRRTLRGGYALPLEGGRWLVSAVGCGDLRPPRDLVGWTAALEALPDPALAAFARTLEPLGDVAVHRQNANRWVHYERGIPPGLLVVGDALCTFNPVYGQGVTIAVLQSRLLRAHCADVTGGAHALRRLQRRLVGCTRLPWLVAAGEDATYPTSTSQPSAALRVADAWTSRLMRAAAHGDAPAHAALTGAYHLLAPPTALVQPRVLLAGLRAHGPAGAAPRPAALDLVDTG